MLNVVLSCVEQSTALLFLSCMTYACTESWLTYTMSYELLVVRVFFCRDGVYAEFFTGNGIRSFGEENKKTRFQAGKGF